MKKRKISATSLIARIKTLSARHRALSAQIEAEQMRPLPDTQRLTRLKRQRLGLKDAIHGARALLAQPGARPPSVA